uniref:Uncharacterized protein n=1 Tax=Anguilla anguilla TaxID=7936 RepID=A0A0E9PB80_ANGAN
MRRAWRIQLFSDKTPNYSNNYSQATV